MSLNNLSVTDVLVKTDDYTLTLFDRNTMKIETSEHELFLDVDDVEQAVDKIENTRYSTLTELDRRILGKIITRKNERYAELAKLKRIDSHSSDYISVISAIEREEDNELTPQETLNRLNEIVDRTIDSLEQHVADTCWPNKLQER